MLKRSASKSATAAAKKRRPWEEVRSAGLSPTEARNPRSRHLDKLPTAAAVDLMLAEETRALRALRAKRRQIARAVNAVGRALRRGGRLFYLGAGTSGRLGVLDAAECPPTFGCKPDRVQALLAGGNRALRRSIEGAEDDDLAGARAVARRNVGRHDVVVGITASGRTPYVWGGLLEARRRRATTVLVTFNPRLRIPRRLRPTICIAAEVGPEVLTGSTRLKAGTATKVLLNTLSTLGMVRAGRVISNLMVDVRPTNAKLRQRAVRILQTLTGADARAAEAALRRTRWVIREALEKPGA